MKRCSSIPVGDKAIDDAGLSDSTQLRPAFYGCHIEQFGDSG